MTAICNIPTQRPAWACFGWGESIRQPVNNLIYMADHIINYNLPPSLTTNKFFLMFVLLIPGKESMNNGNIDVCLAPLVEELQELWRGVDAWDVACPIGSKIFTLHGILMWAIHDLLTYGLLSGEVTKGYKGCPAYGPNNGFHHSRALGKIIYCQHRKLLPLNHPFRSNSCDLDGKVERKPLPPILTRPKILEHATIYEAWKSNGMKEDSIPCTKSGMKGGLFYSTFHIGRYVCYFPNFQSYSCSTCLFVVFQPLVLKWTH